MAPGNLGNRYSDIFGIEGIYKVLIKTDATLLIVNPTQNDKGLRIPPPLKIQIETSGLQTTAVGQKVRFQLLYQHTISGSDLPLSWKAYDTQGNELRSSPQSVPTTTDRDNLAVSLEGSVSLIEFAITGPGDPTLLTICFFP